MYLKENGFVCHDQQLLKVKKAIRQIQKMNLVNVKKLNKVHQIPIKNGDAYFLKNLIPDISLVQALGLQKKIMKLLSILFLQIQILSKTFIIDTSIFYMYDLSLILFSNVKIYFM